MHTVIFKLNQNLLGFSLLVFISLVLIIYVDVILSSLEGDGRKLFGVNFGSLMYADVLILLVPFLNELQAMVNKVCDILDDIDLKLNATRSACIRIAKRCYNVCADIQSSFGSIPWGSQTTHLDIIFRTAKAFVVSNDKAQSNFYSSFNAIAGKLGLLKDTMIILNHHLNVDKEENIT